LLSVHLIDRVHQLKDLFIHLVLVAAGHCLFDTMGQMPFQHLAVRLFDQRLGRQQLGRNIHTIAILLDHPQHGVQLTLCIADESRDLRVIGFHWIEMTS